MLVMQLPGVTQAQYETIRSIIGEGLQHGALLHTSGPTEDGWQIVEVWESPEAMGAFIQSEQLGQAIQVSGITPAQPAIFPVHTFVAAEAPPRA
jgi:hypothetical protein